ncbi:hypothetical protein B0F88_107158 [Methylobacter tundripaludum]|uniref:Uncharacterized protein n=1 Tax=Methylobacter tundripaludum TaxID=173365 RepID=A0A2S6H2G2_9GAMM|nr:hypothetical protein [Methylobacter tundripaludum]PPK71634.1 hypothetical protein B0F88_107158 [Methylobacter tundripaludum]
MPRKIRELIQDLKNAGFYEISGGGKALSRKAYCASFGTGETMKKSDLYHKWVEWSEEDQIYIGKCPDLITGIHGDDPVKLYSELCEVVEDVISHFETEGRTLPSPHIRPMRDVA